MASLTDAAHRTRGYQLHFVQPWKLWRGAHPYEVPTLKDMGPRHLARDVGSSGCGDAINEGKRRDHWGKMTLSLGANDAITGGK